MKAAAEAVATFNKEVLKIEPRGLAPMPQEEAEALSRSLCEEVEEFEDGCQQDDIIACADALIDSIYFALGGLYKMGMTPDQINRVFYAVHSCNMEKTRGTVKRQGVDNHADAVKPEGWVPPEQRIGEILFGAQG